MPGDVQNLWRDYRGIHVLKKINSIKILIAGFFLLFINSAHAEQLLMARTKQNFPEAMLKLQETLTNFNYKVSRIQRVDIGLTKSGYTTDKYRVVFFGKQKEIDLISEKYPELIPYIPWKIAIFAEQEDTLLVTADPTWFSKKKYPGADKYLKEWKKDIDKILAIMRDTE